VPVMDEWMGKESVLYIPNGVLVIKSEIV
jgi:hypothetical protein